MRYHHALITGASGAIGGAFAKHLRQAYPEIHVSLSDLRGERLNERAEVLGGSVHPCDLSRVDLLPEFVEAVEDENGPLDMLVNCAGIMDVRSFGGASWETGKRVLDIDLISPLRLMNLVVPGMLERVKGCIINVSSMAGITPIRGCSYYGASKAGLAMASEIAALELGAQGIHVVTVYPGPVASDLERGARAQLPPTLMTRLVPMGKPDRLALLMLKAVQNRKTRVVYPPLYDIASRFPNVAGQITRWFSPQPLK